MSPTAKRGLRWLALILFVIVAYHAAREYAYRSRSLETVLGLSHGDPTINAGVAALVIVLRLAAYGLVGGAVLAWPLEEWLLRRKAPPQPPGAPAA